MAVSEDTSRFDPKPFGRYVLMEKLAIGGMAEIYKAKTYGVDGFEKLLAIKRILPHCAADKEFIHMLVDEAKLTVLLSHANIVQVFDLGKVSDDYFISMEFIYGTNLREVINRRRERGETLLEEIVVFIISEVCKGLDYAHRKTDSQGNPLNIVHRDISPQNILISYEGEVKIVDFGIAKAAMNVSHTMAGILKGKIAYMSPEQALGKSIDHRTDIFSTGVVLYEMLTGEKLFSGETQFEVLNQIRTTRINTMMLPDSIPGPLKAILVKALSYNLKDRYKSAGDFQLDLTKYLYSSHIDFSPRQLGGLLGQLFEKEIKRKESPAALDDQTRSVLVRQGDRENIVVHGSVTPAMAASGRVVEPSITHPGPSLQKQLMMRRMKRSLIAVGGMAMALLLAYFGYHAIRTSPLSPVAEPLPVPTPAAPVTAAPAPPAPVANPVTTNPQGPLTAADARVKVRKQPVAGAPVDVIPAPATIESNPNVSEGGKPAALSVNSDPSGADVFVNSELKGKTPVNVSNLPAGNVKVVVTKEGFLRYMASVKLNPGESRSLGTIRLGDLFGEVSINSTPPKAIVTFDGEQIGARTPVTIRKVPRDRPHSVKIQLDGYHAWSSTINLKDQGSRKYDILLEKE